MTDATLHSQRIDGGVVLSLSGEIDLENAGRARDRIVDELGSGRNGVVLDLTGISHLDSAGVRLLFDLAGRMQEHRQQLAVVAPPDTLARDVLRVVSLETVVPVTDTLDEALGHVRHRPSSAGP